MNTYERTLLANITRLEAENTTLEKDNEILCAEVARLMATVNRLAACWPGGESYEALKAAVEVLRADLSRKNITMSWYFGSEKDARYTDIVYAAVRLVETVEAGKAEAGE